MKKIVKLLMAAALGGLFATAAHAGYWTQQLNSTSSGYWNVSVPAACTVDAGGSVSGNASGFIHVDASSAGTLVEIAVDSGHQYDYQVAYGPAGTYTVYMSLYLSSGSDTGTLHTTLSW